MDIIIPSYALMREGPKEKRATQDVQASIKPWVAYPQKTCHIGRFKT